MKHVASCMLLMSVLFLACRTGSDEPSGAQSTGPLNSEITGHDGAQVDRPVEGDSTVREGMDPKLRRLLADKRIGLWEPDDQAMGVRFAVSVQAPDVAGLLAAFNSTYPPPDYPGLDLVSVDRGAVFVKVRDGRLLGEGMGTTGSRMYLASATLSLTSHPAVDSVFFDFEEGSHARPGFYSRREWLAVADVDG